jgi:transcriptional regulator with XRE-family HTH domain
MENPLKARRLLAGWTQDDLARYAGVTHDNIVRNEQGLFNRPSPAILATICDYTGEDEERVTKEYQAWIASKRRSDYTRNLVKRAISFPPARSLNQHPFLLWRLAVAPGTSRIAFCQMLCLHPATVLKYETGQQRPMPSQIKTALKEAGMDPIRLDNLAKLGSEYFVHERRRRATAVNAG